MIARSLKNRLSVIVGRHEFYLSKINGAMVEAVNNGGAFQCKSAFEAYAKKALDQSSADISKDLLEAHMLITREFASGTIALRSSNDLTRDAEITLSSFQSDMAKNTAMSVRVILEKDLANARKDICFMLALALRRANRYGGTIQGGFEEHRAAFFKSRTTDSIGRKIESTRALELAVSSAWAQLWNYSMYFILMSSGIEYARINRHDHEADGTVFPIDTYPEIERRLFHPNSWAFIGLLP